jgi:DNA-binding beta-propeller fold protein YncE
VRVLLGLSLALVACTGADSSDTPAADTATVVSTFQGSDPLVLRIPRGGGVARVAGFPNVDSIVWTSPAASPAPGRVLGFDDEAGVIAMLDARSRPVLIDLRAGTIDDSVRVPVVAGVSLDGSTIYGVTAKGEVVRRTPSDFWRYTGGRPARGVFPLRDGSVLIWSGREETSTLSRVRPPSPTVEDSLTMPAADLATGTGVGDRLYFASGEQLHAVQTRTLQLSEPIPIGGPVTDIAVTPSGDRIYVLTKIGSQATLIAIDRYRWRIASQVTLSSDSRELRVDPIGRFVLVRTTADSIDVIDVSRNRYIGAVRSQWRPDLPMVAPDGSIATADSGDVIFRQGVGFRELRRVRGGAADFWFAFWWTGFRPRAAALDEPAKFDSLVPVTDSTAVVATIPDSASTVVVSDSAAAKPAGFTVSFFTLLSQSRAHAEAAKITVEGEAARVETVLRSGTPVYRVILGPYPTCADAQRVARASGRSVWIPEGGCEVPPPPAHEPLAR